MYKVPPIKCLDKFAAVLIAAGMSMLHDALIILTPLPVLWGLKLNWQKKVSLSLMFSVGFFVVACSIIRFPSLLALKYSADPSCTSLSHKLFPKSLSPSIFLKIYTSQYIGSPFPCELITNLLMLGEQSSINNWTIVEEAVGIMCACLPAIRSLISHLFPGLKMSLYGGDRTKSATNGSQAPYARSRTYPNAKSQIQHRTSGRADSQHSSIELTGHAPESVKTGISHDQSHDSDTDIENGLQENHPHGLVLVPGWAGEQHIDTHISGGGSGVNGDETYHADSKDITISRSFRISR